MSKIHLTNTMEMLQRMAERKYQDELALAYSFAGSCQGDMASYSAEQNADEISMKDWQYYVAEIYWSMQDDMERREAIVCEEM